MRSSADFYVFDKWLNAPSYAFGSATKPSLVPPDEKEAYWNIHTDLVEAAQDAIASHPDATKLVLKPKNHSRERGSRGHRPKDLWVSICGSEAKAFGNMPQVYAIASHLGLEVGFAASISEDDYFDADVKARNRTIVPFINAKLPGPVEPLSVALASALDQQGGWRYNSKNRLSPGDDGYEAFGSLTEMLAFLKSSGDETGGGCVCRTYPLSDLGSVDLHAEFKLALDNFAPLIARCAATAWDEQIRTAQTVVETLAERVEFDPTSPPDGRKKVLAEVARRQGQAKFRKDLLQAYDGRCAITGSGPQDVLQAAHITPYLGPSTNHVTNGLLLRADLHTLFDLGLLTINPNSHRLVVSPALAGSPYHSLQDADLRLPDKPSCRPSSLALAQHFAFSMGKHGEAT